MAKFEKKTVVHNARPKFESRNIYRQSLINLYNRITKHSSDLNIKRIASRLRMSNTARHPVKITRLADEHAKNPENILVVVAKVLDDNTVFVLPKMRICCLDISLSAKVKIEKFGGEVYTVDRLFEESDGLKDITLVKGDMTARKCYKYFGAAGEKGSLTYPRTSNKGKNGEKRLLK